ncbi:hypothetical protein [Jeotgalibacillus campisalis]|nr:hypothetical protein [Jeotgalibacillus campisalis]
MEKDLWLRKLASIILLVASCLVIAGCSGSGAANSNDPPQTDGTTDENLEEIQAVIEKEFTAPDEKFRELNDAAMEAQQAVKDQDEQDNFMKTPVYKDLTDYREDTYALHFTEGGYERFINTGLAFNYSNYDGNFKMTPSNIEIRQSENHPALYHFTYQVNVENEKGETNQYNFEGKANVPEGGKIAEIEFVDKDDLQQELNGG